MRIRKVWSVLLILCLICTLLPAFEVNAAGEQVKAGISVSPQTISEDEIVNVKISLEGIPYEGKIVPNDVVLVIDRSGSMTSYKTDLLNAARQFINMVDLTTHRIGIVDYDNQAESFQISQDADKLLEYIDLIAGKSMGGTAIHLGVDEAVNLLKNKRSGATGAIVLMTDGQSDETLALEAAERAKARGYTFFTVALCSSETGSANTLLKKMATSEADHHFVWPSSGLPEVYKVISKQIGYAHAKDVAITQKIADQFELVPGSADSNIPVPTINGQWLIWDITQLGEGISNLSYQLKVKDGVKTGTYYHSSAGNIVYTTYNGGTANINLPAQKITVNNSVMTLNSVTPTEYGIAGGETVTITGTHIKSNADVTIGGIKIANPIITGGNQITFTMPAHVQGTDSIVVTNPDGQSASLSVQFKATPVITAISPKTGPFVGGTKVKISTQNVMAGATVTFDGISAIVDSLSGGILTVVSPKVGKEGAVDIIITNPDGTTVTASDAFVYEPDLSKILPVITSITPDNGKEKTSVKVTIIGNNFKGGISGVTVTVGGVKVKLLSATSTKLIFRVPNTFGAGVQPVVIKNQDGGIATTQYTYGSIPVQGPTITSITPNNGDEKTGTKVTVVGKNFKSPTVTVGGIKVSLLTNTDTKLIFRVPDSFSAGVQEVLITNSDGGSVKTQYTYNGTAPVVVNPVISSITPDSGDEKTGTKVTVEGNNFKSPTVTVGGIAVSLLTNTDTKLIFRVPDSFTAGVQEVLITNNDGGSAKTQYTYNGTAPVIVNPVISSITPDSEDEKTGTKVTVEGKHFDSPTVTVGGIKVSLLTNTDTKLIFRVPDSFAAGVQEVLITNNDGGSVKTQYTYLGVGLTNVIPIINSVSVTSCIEGETPKITISGTNFLGDINSVKVKVGSKEVKPLSVSATNIVFRIPDNLAVGVYPITVINADGQQAAPNKTFTVNAKATNPAPIINSMTPNVGTVNNSQKVVVLGNNFDTSGLVVTISSGTSSITISPMLTLQKDELIFRIPELTAGTYTVTLTNPDGQNATCVYTVN